MQNEYVQPVDHGAGSAAVGVAAGGIKGALGTFGKTVAWTAAAFATFGLLSGLGLFTVALPMLGTAAGGSIGSALASTVGWGALGGLVAGPVLGGFTSVFGAGKGMVNAAEQVRAEKSAAGVMQAQVRAMEVQAAMSQMPPANEKNYGFPAQGAPMNPAAPMIQAAGSGAYADGKMPQAQGVLASNQLQVA